MHSKYSLLDSISEPEKLVEKIIEQGKKALCITEHGNLYSSVEFYKLCKKNNIKYLHGCEMYICDDVNVKSKDNKYHHLVLISKNEIGRLNLIKLVSKSNHFKYYGKPRIDFNMLLQHKEGLIVLSACMAGEIQRNLLNNDVRTATKIATKYKESFGEDYYLEYQSHNEHTQQKLNRIIVDIAKKLNIKYVVTTDSHYINKEDQKYHSVFVQIGQSREVGETYNDCFVQTEEDVLNICKSTTQEENLKAIQTTHEISNKCNVKLPLSAPIMPHVNVPSTFKNEIEYLKQLCLDGWKKRNIHLLDKETRERYKTRLGYEIRAIQKMGFEGYFLLVWGYANSVIRRGIARGSGGGSLVAYLVNIVDTDPVKYGLYFERFIDIGALELLENGIIAKSQLKIPDFDLDFGKADREKVLAHVIREHGIERVASLGSFQYIWAKGAIKDIGKVLNIPFEITNEMTSKLDGETIQDVLDLGLLHSYESKYPELFEYANRLAGLPKSFSAHPCGKIISMEPVDYYNAIDINDNGDIILQGDMHTAEDLGLIKADFLGLRTVDVIYDTLDAIGKDYEYIAPHNINFEDKEVLLNFRSGNTSGIFQFESTGMQSTLKNIECNSLYDLTVANALYRPGSMAYIQNYADRRKGIEEYVFLHDDLKPILKDSYGIIVFQEQLIEIGKLANLSNPDELRQATAKKKPELLEKIKPELFCGLFSRGWSQEQVEQLWEIMIDFARYSFNKSHALAYAMIAYICMYLKVHHTREFLCSWINSNIGKTEKLPECIRETNRLGIKLYDIEFGKTQSKTFLYRDGIMLGINSIKYCNSKIADELMKLSQNHYGSFVDLLSDINTDTSINTKQLKILTGLNFFKRFGNNKLLLGIIDIYDNLCNRKQINIKDLSKLGLSEELLKKYSGKKTPSLYKELDISGLITELSSHLENKSLSIIEQVKFDMEYLESTSYTNSKVDSSYYIVVGFKTYKDPAKPYLILRQIKTGDEVKTKIKQSKIFKESPFGAFSVLKINEFSNQYKSKMINGKWQKTDEIETVLEEYEVIK